MSEQASSNVSVEVDRDEKKGTVHVYVSGLPTDNPDIFLTLSMIVFHDWFKDQLSKMFTPKQRADNPTVDQLVKILSADIELTRDYMFNPTDDDQEAILKNQGTLGKQMS